MMRLANLQQRAARVFGTAPGRPAPGRPAAGFTLVEMLVALLLLGIMSALGYGTYRQARISAERAAQSQQRTREIEFGIRIMVQDIAQIVPRPIRETIGDGRQPSLHGDVIKLSSSGAATVVEMTRAGWSNTAGVQRGTFQRVSYQLDKETLKRLYQPVLDPTLSNKPVEQQLLTQVKSVSLRYLDRNRVWSDAWPAAGIVPPESWYTRPVAIELNIEFKDWGKVRRLIEVAG
jgi:general secretion pathway protein J